MTQNSPKFSFGLIGPTLSLDIYDAMIGNDQGFLLSIIPASSIQWLLDLIAAGCGIQMPQTSTQILQVNLFILERKSS